MEIISIDEDLSDYERGSKYSIQILNADFAEIKKGFNNLNRAIKSKSEEK